MESESLEWYSRAAVAQWADLPTDLIAIIIDGLPNPYDIILFRSVCRSWRLSIPPLSPNILSPFFPLTISFPRTSEDLSPINLIASAIHLLRPRRDPSRAWMVSLQESDAGNLLLRHPLTYEKIAGLPVNSIDSSEWSVTQIAMSYGYNNICGDCNQIERTEKVDLVSNFSCGGSGISVRNRDPEAVALCKDHWNRMYEWKFSLGARSETSASQSFCDLGCEIEDFVKFNGCTFYAIDTITSVYVFDCNNLGLNRLNCGSVLDCSSAKSYRKRLVVSDGDLYMVLRFRREFGNPPECLIYKLMDHVSCWEWERVGNLEDSVFFISRDCSFSVPARDLPHPWKGNCVLLEKEGFPLCGCFSNDNEIEVFHLGHQYPQFSLLSMLRGYSDLFTPPSFILDQSGSCSKGRSLKMQTPHSDQLINRFR